VHQQLELSCEGPDRIAGRPRNPVLFLVSRRVLYYPRSPSLSGRSAAWLARLVRDQEVEGSNPFAPTILIPALI
jgi:hypothetical protein